MKFRDKKNRVRSKFSKKNLKNMRKSRSRDHLEHVRMEHENLARELQKMLVLRSYVDSSSENESSSENQKNRGVLVINDAFSVEDVLNWIVSKDGGKDKRLESKLRREAWRTIQVMFDLGIIDLVNRNESRENVDVIFKGYSAWYYFTDASYNLGPLNHQIENLSKQYNIRECKSKVEILWDPAPCDGYITAINLSFVSKPKLRSKWSVVIFEHISQKNSIEYESHSNSKKSVGSKVYLKEGKLCGYKIFPRVSKCRVESYTLYVDSLKQSKSEMYRC